MHFPRSALTVIAAALLVTTLGCGSEDDDDRSSPTKTTLECDNETVISALNAGEDAQGCVPTAP
jgi:hypothetical protein